jgi:hypothetical protein
MTICAEFVTDEVGAGEIEDVVEKVIFRGRKLPDQVFRPPLTYFAFYDYGVLQTKATTCSVRKY